MKFKAQRNGVSTFYKCRTPVAGLVMSMSTLGFSVHVLPPTPNHFSQCLLEHLVSENSVDTKA